MKASSDTRKKIDGGSGQHARFLEAAREAGADVDTDAADRLMRRLAKTPPEPKKQSAARALKGERRS